MFEYFFQRSEKNETQKHVEFEVNLFKAYLVFNSEFTKAQKTAFTSTEHLNNDLRIPMITFCMHYPISDKINYNTNQLWVTQIIKSIYLFQFLEVNEKLMQLLTAFLAHFNKLTWQEFFKNLIPLTIPAIKNEKESHTDISVPFDQEFE